MSWRQNWPLLGGACLLLAFAVAPGVFPSPFFRVAMGNLVPLAVIGAACIVSVRNAVDSRGHPRMLWGLMAAGMVLWGCHQAVYTWLEVVIRQPMRHGFPGDIVLFLHIVPIMAAVTIRPYRANEGEGIWPSTMNVLMLVVWWVVVYTFFVFPDEYIVPDFSVFRLRWVLLYRVEMAALIVMSGSAYYRSSGSWRELYRNILLASLLCTFSWEAMHEAVVRGTYKTGGIYDVIYVAAALAFLWVAVAGRRRLGDTETMPSTTGVSRPVTIQLAQLALLSLPVMGYWALFLSGDRPYLARVRFVVAMSGVAVLAFFVFLKQHLLDRRLRQLLDHSHQGLENLQRLQGRVVQQAKLASLGELVALAASELEFPLAAILSSSERMAASSSLSREQLASAQKIGQQARRTRELVSDLLSFAQQTPGEKSPLDLKPLLQRAVQMEGFKLENKKISLTVESGDPLPRVRGNGSQLLQAFLQIVENAVDALREVGGGRLQVSLWREEDEVVVQFADSGPGLRNPERVFDPFYTTKPVGKGTGLGLSAAYGVIQDHKGQITCYNRPEGGAVFEIRLPALTMTAQAGDGARG
ncbi:MAG: sensor histidine kinase [Terriglobales bacterium]